MAEGKRPGGLTALAVLNFVFGGLGALAFLALFALMKAADTITKGEVSNAPGSGSVYIALALGLVTVVLMITSGVGYLGQKKFLGRTLGNAYAALSILNQVLSLVLLHQGFGISNIIGFIYPALTLFLLNTTFKEDLVN